MPSHSGSELDSVRLSESSAAVLLARATQLESVRADKVTVAELRQAARDAGIAPEAFEEALREFRAASAVADVAPPEHRRGRRYWVGFVLAAALLLVYMLFRSVVAITPSP